MGKLTILGEGSSTPLGGGPPGASCSRKPEVNVIGDESGGVGALRFMGRAAVVTLGCAKNHVDSEVMLGVLKSRGFEIVSDVSHADVAVVNTCGFLQSAVQESIDCILDIAELKKTGQLRKLVVAGCAVERYSDPSGKYGSIKEALPEVDSFISVNEILKVADAASLSSLPGESTQSPLDAALESAARPYFLYDDTMPRELATKRFMAYVKVSEGCNRPCTFCIIPRIRGTMRSRAIDSVLREVDGLASMGVREINLVAQDLTSYGLDLDENEYGRGRRLVKLLEALDKQGAVDWIRLLYAYPVGTDEALLDAIVSLPRVVEYLDIPLQHSAEGVLTRMKRPVGRYAPRPMVEWMRTRAPSVAIRTTFIVGFPGETEEDIADLEQFISEGHFSSVGIFTYSAEPGTPANEMEHQVSERAKASRRGRLMKAQQKVVEQRLRAMVGTSLQVLVEGQHEDTELLLTGRARFQAPEVDGTVIINDFVPRAGANETETKEGLLIPSGEMVTVRIDDIAGYDLVGAVVGD